MRAWVLNSIFLVIRQAILIRTLFFLNCNCESLPVCSVWGSCLCRCKQVTDSFTQVWGFFVLSEIYTPQISSLFQKHWRGGTYMKLRADFTCQTLKIFSLFQYLHSHAMSSRKKKIQKNKKDSSKTNRKVAVYLGWLGRKIIKRLIIVPLLQFGRCAQYILHLYPAMPKYLKSSF